MEKNDLSQGWALANLENVITRISNGTTEKQTKTPTKFPVSRIETISNEFVDFNNVRYLESPPKELIEKYRLVNGDILFSNINSDSHLGKSAIYNSNKLLLHGMNLLLIRSNNDVINSKFLNYLFNYFRHIGKFISIAQHAVNQSSINQTKLKNLELTIPPLNEQKRIIKKMDELFSTSKHLRNLLNESLLRLATLKNSLLREVFTGKLVSQNPNDPPVKIISVIQKKNTGRKASKDVIVGGAALSVGKPNIVPPKGWKWVPLLQIAELASGHTPKRQNPEYWNGEIQWVTGGDAGKYDGDYIFETKETITQLGIENSAAVILPKDTVCLAREASIGFCVLLGKPMATNQRFVNFICGESLLPKYLMYLFLFERNFMFRFKEGSIFGTIYFPSVKAFHICLPPLNEQKRIIKKIDSLWSFTKKIESGIILKINTLNSFEIAVLKYAFEGKLVPQDPNDEPAAELLARIKAENEKQSKKK